MKPITILVIALFAAMLFTDVDVSAQEMPDSLIVSPAVNADTDSVPPMTLAVSPDSVAAAQEKPHSSTLWIKQLLDNGFLINDPGVDYPKFPRFLVKVYNWGDKVFNSYDPEYVVSTGKTGSYRPNRSTGSKRTPCSFQKDVYGSTHTLMPMPGRISISWPSASDTCSTSTSL